MKGIECPYTSLAANPLDIFEEIVHDKNWAFDRRGGARAWHLPSQRQKRTRDV